MYSNEAERANTIYGGCKFKKKPLVSMVYEK